MGSLLRIAVGGVVVLAWSLIGFAEESKPSGESSPGKESKPSVTKHDRLLASLQTTAEALRSRSIETAELPQFQELLAAAEAYWQDTAVPLDRRGKYCGLAKARLAEAAAMLRRQEAAAVQLAKNGGAKRPQSIQPRQTTLAQVAPLGTPPQQPGAPNPAEQEAQKLIDLIQSVVRPETWDVNGGQGIIKYWSLGHGLVIYNTGDVHERIGGSVGFLRK